jgi:hypothetical protein
MKEQGINEIIELLLEIFDVDHVADVVASWKQLNLGDNKAMTPVKAAEILYFMAVSRPGFVDQDIKKVLNYNLVMKVGFIAERLEKSKPDVGQDIRNLEFVEIGPNHVLFQYPFEKVATGTQPGGDLQNVIRLSGDFFRRYYLAVYS